MEIQVLTKALHKFNLTHLTTSCFVPARATFICRTGTRHVWPLVSLFDLFAEAFTSQDLRESNCWPWTNTHLTKNTQHSCKNKQRSLTRISKNTSIKTMGELAFTGGCEVWFKGGQRRQKVDHREAESVQSHGVEGGWGGGCEVWASRITEQDSKINAGAGREPAKAQRSYVCLSPTPAIRQDMSAFTWQTLQIHFWCLPVVNRIPPLPGRIWPTRDVFTLW